jgi:hypothetical protein
MEEKTSKEGDIGKICFYTGPAGRWVRKIKCGFSQWFEVGQPSSRYSVNLKYLITTGPVTTQSRLEFNSISGTHVS